jgi:ABC-2 type transport system permease protein
VSDTPAAFQERGIIASVTKLLRLRLVILANGFRRAKRRKKIAYIGTSILVMGFLGFVLFISTVVLAFLRSPKLVQYVGNPAPFLESFPAMILSVSALGILFTSFGVLLQVLYLSGDMDFLMSAPVPIRAVFVAKLIQAILPNFSILCLLTLPVLFGLGISSGYHFLYYPFVIIVLATVALAAASLAGLLVLIVARFFPPRRVAEVLGFVLGITVFTSSQSARFVKFDLDKVSNNQIAGYLNMMTFFNRDGSPMAWAGRGLVELGQSRWLISSGLLLASLAFAGIIFYVALSTSERLYYTGWASLRNQSRKSKDKTRARASLGSTVPDSANPFTRLVPAPVRAIMIKDLRLFRRDLASLSSLLFPMVLGIIYAISLLRSSGKMPAGRGKAPPAFMQAGNALLGYADIALALFLGWMLVSNLAGFGFSREGKSYWILKAAPINPRRLITAKFLVGYLPPAIVCSIYILVLEILKRADPWAAAFKLISVCMMLAGLTGIYLALGIRGARFDWENPAQVHRTIGCLGVLSGMLFLVICSMLFIFPVVLAQLFHFPTAAGQLFSLILGGVACALAVVIPLGLIEPRVTTLNEDS